jgi:Fic family protein
MKTNRIIIYPKDVQRITGKSDRYGRMLLKKIRQQFLKEPHQFVSVDEFCQFTGLELEKVTRFLND